MKKNATDTQTDRANRWRLKAEALWDLLDDIDTASDMFKPEQTTFYKYVMAKAELRHRYLHSDGYVLRDITPVESDPDVTP